jgi:hypothetical protein
MIVYEGAREQQDSMPYEKEPLPVKRLDFTNLPPATPP